MYEETAKAYRVYDIERRSVVVSRDVNFDEAVVGGLVLYGNDVHYSLRDTADILDRLDDFEDE
ncbi:hypothetical protein DAPPUDRAFT_277496, partial [Daphnia pulex]